MTTIKDINGNIIFKSEKGNIREAVFDAIEKGVSLSGANLSGADLREAYLYKAKIGKENIDEFMRAIGVIVTQ